jgi:osmotically-inducible protein OsmY
MRHRVILWTAFLGLLLLGPGCSSQDSEGLTRVCQKVTEKSDNLTGGRQSKLAAGWRALRGSAGGGAVDSRVAFRLRWDKSLADADIQVSMASPGVVKLQGTIANQMQRGRALELAKSTQGVTDAVDALEMKKNAE